MKHYAAETSVSVEKTRAEIEALLKKYGAHRFCYMNDEKGAAIAFTILERNVRFLMPLPPKNLQEFTHWKHSSGRWIARQSEGEITKEWDQACRSRWRALLLCIKAKLEACAVGITTFEQEFLAHLVLHDGRTVGEAAIPQLTSGGPLLLEMGAA